MVNLVQNSKNSTNQVQKLNLIDKIVSRIQELDDYDKLNASSSNGLFYSHPVNFQVVNNKKCAVSNKPIQANRFTNNFSNLKINKNESSYQKGKKTAQFYSP